MGRLLTRAKFLGWLHAVGRIDDRETEDRDGLCVSICMAR